MPALIMLASMFAYAAAVVLGLPLLWCYRRFGIQRFSAYAVGGFAIGLLLGLFAFTTAAFRVSAGLGGTLGASFFWALAIRSSAVRGLTSR